MHAPIKYVEKGLSIAANSAWHVYKALNRINQGGAFTPGWSDKPMLKSYQKTKPPLGWPRETDSLCPTCVREARQLGYRVASSVKTKDTTPMVPTSAQCRSEGRSLM